MNAAQATEALTMALIQLADQGRRPRCSDPGDRELWFSDHQAERDQAAHLCKGCPVLDACHDAAEANREKHGVWAGVERSPKRKRAAA